jgi:hypothetical protein
MHCLLLQAKIVVSNAFDRSLPEELVARKYLIVLFIILLEYRYQDRALERSLSKPLSEVRASVQQPPSGTIQVLFP